MSSEQTLTVFPTMSSGAAPTNPSDMLSGMVLSGGWVVGDLVVPGPSATGGHFSSSYTVTREGQSAFLKALDYVAALNDPDPPQALADLTAAFLFERDLLKSCEASKMRNVIRILDDGIVNVVGGGAIPRVSYLIFEAADGDIRHFRALTKAVDISWILRSMHHATLGIQQLHARGAVHQDLKPSNLLTFAEGALAKVGDLGCASVQGAVGPRDHFQVAGDGNYAPPEAFYGFVAPDWNVRRRACDLFHLGSLLLFQFTGATANAALFAELDIAFWPAASGGRWVGAFDDVLIYLRDSVSVVADQFPDLGDARLNDETRACFRQLCEPDPRLRGHPKNHADRFGDPYGLERYVSSFNALAARADRNLRSIAVK